jgi:hypothetical protein
MAVVRDTSQARTITGRLFAAACVVVAVGAIGRGATPTDNAAAEQAVFEAMVKNAITALNHANLTGNYTVLRDLGGEEFRRRNSAADLAQAFAPHRERRYDLSPILCLPPQFAQPPQVEGDRLTLVGTFATQPEAVKFVVAYQRDAGGWGLDAISVAMQSAAASGEAAPVAQQLAPGQ